MTDELIRGTAWGGAVRVFGAKTTELVRELQRRHDTFPTASAALGRTATAAAMMGFMLKGDEKLTVQVKGDGPIGQIVVDANAAGEVKGYVDYPHTHLPSNSLGKLDVSGAVGKTGFLNVTKDLGLKEPYRGSVPSSRASWPRTLRITSRHPSRRLPPSGWASSSIPTTPCCMRADSSSRCCRTLLTSSYRVLSKPFRRCRTSPHYLIKARRPKES